VAAWLAEAGIALNGAEPWDPKIVRARALWRCARGTLEAGMAYADGDWDCEALDEFTARMLRAYELREFEVPGHFGRWHQWIPTWLLANPQSRRRAREAVRHYEGRFDLFRTMLGPSLAYSCGFWADAATLDEAQDAKHELICRKLGLAPGMRVLDVGCGWGGFAEYAARHHRVNVTGVTLADEQATIARERTVRLPVTILTRDYRETTGTFDRVVSIGMFEHVGPRNHRLFFEKLRSWLRPDGLALLHTIGGKTSTTSTDPWLNAFIFPGSVLPSVAQIGVASEGLFVVEDWHNFGADYDRTLRAWHDNVARAWPNELAHYPEQFRRTWRYYLLTCAGMFRARSTNLWQLVLSPRGVPGGYRRPC
jgi:cyclopropane-fatty-acyl-phospholipid synthase